MAGETSGALNQEKYLTFFLGQEEYGVEVQKVRQITAMVDITPLPRSPDHLKGVINLRGRLVPVIDLRERFRMAPRPYDERTCIIVMETRGGHGPSLTGVVVDRVHEVLPVSRQEVESVADNAASFQHAYIHGLAKAKGRVTILLDMDRLVSIEDGTQPEPVTERGS